MVVSRVVAGVTHQFYKTAHVVGGRFGQAPFSVSNESRLFRFLPDNLPREVGALWRQSVLRSLELASALHRDDIPGLHQSESSGSFQARYQPIPGLSRAAFLRRFENLPTADQQGIRLAYDIGLAAHGEQVRDIGGPYFSHPKSVALILVDDCGLKDARLAIAALLHDLLEDTTLVGLDLVEARKSLTRLFGSETAETIIALTRQTLQEKALMEASQKKDRALQLKRYLEQLTASPIGTVLVKLADRLHNGSSVLQLEPRRQRRFVTEAREIFLPFFGQADFYYSAHPQYLNAARFLRARLAVQLAAIEAQIRS